MNNSNDFNQADITVPSNFDELNNNPINNNSINGDSNGFVQNNSNSADANLNGPQMVGHVYNPQMNGPVNNQNSNINGQQVSNTNNRMNMNGNREMVAKKNSAKKKKKKIRIKKLIFPISCMILLLSIFGYVTYVYFNDKPSLSPIVKEIIDEHKKDNPDKPSEPSTEIYVNKLPLYRKQYNNNYISALLQIPSVKIDSLITRSGDNEYYLNHSLSNQYDEMGTPFIDYRNYDIDNNRQVNMYGHNTQYSKYYDRLPFTNLEAYTDQNVFNDCKDIYLSTDKNKYRYQVIAVKIVKNHDITHMKLIFKDDNDWLTHVKALLSNTMYLSVDPSSIKADDKLLILQACHYNPMNSYILIIAKRV